MMGNFILSCSDGFAGDSFANSSFNEYLLPDGTTDTPLVLFREIRPHAGRDQATDHDKGWDYRSAHSSGLASHDLSVFSIKARHAFQLHIKTIPAEMGWSRISR